MNNYFIEKKQEKRKKLTKEIKEIIIEILNLDLALDDIPDDAILFGGGLDLDSIDALQLVVGIESHFGITLPQENTSILRSVNTLVDYMIKTENEHVELNVINENENEYEINENNKTYFSLRNDVGYLDRSDLAILKISGENIFESMDKIVTGKLQFLQENTVLQTLILNEDGSILSYIELHHHGDYYWILLNHENLEAVKSLLEKEFFSHQVEDITNQFAIIDIAGPNAVALVENCFDTDVIGMRPKMIVKTFLDEERKEENAIWILRTHSFGEFGYQMILLKENLKSFYEALQKSFGKNLVKCDLSVIKLAFLEAFSFHEENFLPNNENPFMAGLQWMIDLKKDAFIGKEALINIQAAGLKQKLVLFTHASQLEPLETNHPIYLDNKKIGYVSTSLFSHTLNHVIGLAYIDSKNAWPGFRIDEIGMEIVSAPFFLSKSFTINQ